MGGGRRRREVGEGEGRWDKERGGGRKGTHRRREELQEEGERRQRQDGWVEVLPNWWAENGASDPITPMTRQCDPMNAKTAHGLG